MASAVGCLVKVWGLAAVAAFVAHILPPVAYYTVVCYCFVAAHKLLFLVVVVLSAVVSVA